MAKITLNDDPERKSPFQVLWRKGNKGAMALIFKTGTIKDLQGIDKK